MARRHITAYPLGRVEYDDGLELQARFVQAREKGLVSDTLLLLEHPPVLTLGRKAARKNVLASDERLKAEGVELFETDRGGDVTYHGPGQIVGYPLFHLAPDRQDVRRYVRDVEECIIRALRRFGIESDRFSGRPGVWVGEGRCAEKIAAIGVHLSRWYTRHGFALNVNTHLPHFSLIVPCGIRDASVTSMQKLLRRALPIAEVEHALAESFAEVFDASLSYGTFALRTVSVAVLRGEQVLLLRRVRERGGFWQLVTGRVEAKEAPADAARRELWEETGADARVLDLGYRHAFAFGEELPPKVAEESAYAARWPEGREVRLDRREHDAYEWVAFDEALSRLPFRGLRRAVELAKGMLP